jgi:hypothetical protein
MNPIDPQERAALPWNGVSTSIAVHLGHQLSLAVHVHFGEDALQVVARRRKGDSLRVGNVGQPSAVGNSPGNAGLARRQPECNAQGFVWRQNGRSDGFDKEHDAGPGKIPVRWCEGWDHEC